MNLLYKSFISFFFLLLVACDSTTHYAPVTEINPIEPIPKAGTHRVMRYETLYEIAWRYGLDYRSLAARNNISPPYGIQMGQILSLRDGESLQLTPKTEPKIFAPEVSAPQQIKSNPTVAYSLPNKNFEPNFSISKWIWPVKGRIINRFSPIQKGINIGGRQGDPIYAPAPGKVVYSGNGLRGYGNLIIIKHNSLYLSAYAHNEANYVREGDWVRQGQKIAEMGNTGADKVMLHFEVRRAGKPINPLVLLNS